MKITNIETFIVDAGLETVAKLTYPVGSRWMNDVLTVFNEVDSLWRRIDEWAGEELARSD